MDDHYRTVRTRWSEMRIRERLSLFVGQRPDYYDLDAATADLHERLRTPLRHADVYLAADGLVLVPASLSDEAAVALVDRHASALDWAGVLRAHERTWPCRMTLYTVEECSRVLENAAGLLSPRWFDTSAAAVELHAALAGSLPSGFSLDHAGGLLYPPTTAVEVVDETVRQLGYTLAGSDVLGTLRRFPYRPAD